MNRPTHPTTPKQVAARPTFWTPRWLPESYRIMDDSSQFRMKVSRRALYLTPWLRPAFAGVWRKFNDPQ